MKKYKIKAEKIGMQYCDIDGCIILSDKISQKKLKELYEKRCPYIYLSE
jgi:hypothetical protein